MSRDILRKDFHAFIHRAFIELNTGTPFQDNWHIGAIADALERVRLGLCRRLIINLPPRSLKSHCASIAFPAWVLGQDPTRQIIAVSYAQDLADKHARDCRHLMLTQFYRDLFDTRLSPDRQAASEFETTAQGYRLSTSVGGVLTGRGGNFLIVDDPLKPEDAVSDARRSGANNFYDTTLYSRQNDKQRDAIVLVMHRLHEDDLVGHVLPKEDWEVLSFPAIAEREQKFEWDTPYGRQSHTRKIGTALHPAREPLATLETIRASVGSYAFAGQYQQSPAPFGGGMVKPEWFQRYEPHQLPEEFDYKLQSWDTANKPNELANFSVCTTWGVKKERVYLLHVLRRHLGYPELKRAVQAQADAFGPKIILIEDRASGTQLIQELAASVPGITKYEPDGDKIMRMNAQTAVIENGSVHIPHAAHWLDEYLHELATFPKGKFSDQVDSTSQALAWMKSNRVNQGEVYLEFYRRLVEGAPPPTPGPTVLMKAPPSVVSTRVNDGRLLKRGPDGIFRVPLDLVHLMLTSGWTKVAG